MDKLKLNIIEIFKENNIIKEGDFVLNSGEKSTFYYDLKSLVSYPQLLTDVCDSVYKLLLDYYGFNNIYALIVNNKIKICGVPLGGIPFASYISTKYDIPMIMVRKERKKYGTQKQIEGVYNNKDECIIFEDVITTGKSINEILEILDNKINVKAICVIINRSKIQKIRDVPIIELININL